MVFSNAYFQLLLGSILTSYAGSPFYAGAYQALKQGLPNMDVLVALSISAAYLYSQYHVFLFGANGIGIGDSSQLLFRFDRHGPHLDYVRQMDGSDRERQRLAEPVFALLASSGFGDRRSTEWDAGASSGQELRIGTLISVATGEGIPTDGIVTDGMAEIEESLLTGEALLAIRKTG